MKKPRILHVGEASFLKTGYATYAYEIQKRLYATGKYELAELGCFASQRDIQVNKLPWKFYGNLPDKSNPIEIDLYNSNNLHAFGSWKFEEVLLDFQPDIVWDIRDWWHMEFEERSPFRPYYHWAIMPTVDAFPQNTQWLATFCNADGVFTYSDWGLSVLKENNGLINTISSAPPGADLNVFYPAKNKAEHKKQWGLSADSFIIGTIMRNQKRKLYPELIRSFSMFLKQAPKQIADKSYLYMHTSYPDWWDLPALAIEHEVSHRCLFTYKCLACKHVFLSFFQDARGVCVNCHKAEAFLPNTHIGIERHELASIINNFDVYIQYANSEGFGMPQIEASSCGIPLFVVDYSAMSDIVRKLKGYPIKVQSLQKEADTGCDRAIPDNQSLVDQLIRFSQLPQSMKDKKAYDTRKATELYYDWNKTAKIWENYFDSIQLKNHENTWKSPVKTHQYPTDIPINLSAEEFVQWALLNVVNQPELCNSYMALRMTRDIQWKSTTDNTGQFFQNEMSAMGIRPKRKDFTKEDAVRELIALRENINMWEKRRGELLNV